MKKSDQKVDELILMMFAVLFAALALGALIGFIMGHNHQGFTACLAGVLSCLCIDDLELRKKKREKKE